MDVDDTAPLFVISIAAELAGMHPQTLRQYDRLGLVSPGRAAGRGRRYSARDVHRLREVQRLSQEGLSLAGIKRVLELENENDALRARLSELLAELSELKSGLATGARVFAAGASGDIVAVPRGRRPKRLSPPSTALVIWRPPRPPERS